MKTLFEIIVSLLLLIILLPVLLLITLLVYKNVGSPVLFKQVRPGLYGKPFEMWKFRSMRDAYDENGIILPDNERLTNFGVKLRSTSLDELPGLWNVLRGEMSLVGPRPLLMEYLTLYSEKQLRRHDVKPGITGWAQVNGRNRLTWDKKLELDVWYVENRSIFLDLKILFLTALKVICRDGITQDGHETTKKFEGNLE